MEPLSIIGALALSIAALIFNARVHDEYPAIVHFSHEAQSGSISPKFLIISAFKPEAEVWYGIPDFDLLGQNITVPGKSAFLHFATLSRQARGAPFQCEHVEPFPSSHNKR